MIPFGVFGKNRKKAEPEMALPFKHAALSLTPYIISTRLQIRSSSSG